MMKLVEESSGIGELLLNGHAVCRGPYRLNRLQGFVEESGLPVPGLHRIEGYIELHEGAAARSWIGVPMTLRLENGRLLGVSLVDEAGRLVGEGHGPSKCGCC
jgi:hypothetical protein